MRLGLVLSTDYSVADSLPLAQRAEALGFDSLWLGEAWGRDLFTQLGYLAAHTSRIKLATGIVNVFSRTPGLVAQSIATLDELSHGRAILGLGSSGERVVRNWHGLDFEAPLQRTREYIEIVRLALAGKRVDYQGKFFKLQGFTLRFRPRRERVPIYLAALGPRNLRLTGELADGWSPVFFAPSRLPQFREELERGAQVAGRRAADVQLAPWLLTSMDPDPAVARMRAKRHIAFYIGGMGRYYHELFSRYGFGAEVAQVQYLWNGDREVAAETVSDAMLDHVAIVGDAQACRTRLKLLEKDGFDRIILLPAYGMSLEQSARMLEALAPSSRP